MKLKLLTSLLYTKFQEYVVLRQNVSFNKIIVLFAKRFKYILKIKNKLVLEGFKV